MCYTRRANPSLRAFYAKVFDTNAFGGDAGTCLPTRVEVDDVDETLARVWNLGGAIVSASDWHALEGTPIAATFRDPGGNLVSIFSGRPPARTLPTSAPM